MMRKRLLTIILCACCAPAAGQELFTADDLRIFYGTLQLGANFSQVDGDGFSGYRKVGIAGGASVIVRPFSQIGVSLGLGYAQKGSNEARITETMIGPAVFRYRIHLQYAEVPLLLHLFPGPECITGQRFSYSAGVSYSRLLGWTETSESIYPIRISPELYPFRKQDWSSIVGITWRIHDRWFLNGQYQYTIGSIRSGIDIPPGYGGGRQRNNVMSLRLSYVIGSGGERLPAY